MEALLALAGALVVAVILDALQVPGGLVVGGTLGAIAVVVVRNREIRLSMRTSAGIQILVGLLVGVRLTPDTLSQLGPQFLPAMLATVIIIVAGLIIARVLHRFGKLPSWVVLATSPGGLEAVVAVAVERRDGPVEVALFHFVRILAVLLSIPLLVWLLGA